MTVKCINGVIFPMGSSIHKDRVMQAELRGDWYFLENGCSIYHDIFWTYFEEIPKVLGQNTEEIVTRRE